jgi:N-acetylneuraminic acid mutarotase
MMVFLTVGTGKNEINPVSEVHVFDVESSQWEEVQLIADEGSGTPAPRFAHSATACANNKKLVVFGGSNNYKYFGADDVWTLESSASRTWKWTKVITTNDTPRPRFSHTATLVSGNGTGSSPCPSFHK